jgi:hypothetical protein
LKRSGPVVASGAEVLAMLRFGIGQKLSAEMPKACWPVVSSPETKGKLP